MTRPVLMTAHADTVVVTRRHGDLRIAGEPTPAPTTTGSSR